MAKRKTRRGRNGHNSYSNGSNLRSSKYFNRVALSALLTVPAGAGIGAKVGEHINKSRIKKKTEILEKLKRIQSGEIASIRYKANKDLMSQALKNSSSKCNACDLLNALKRQRANPYAVYSTARKLSRDPEIQKASIRIMLRKFQIRNLTAQIERMPTPDQGFYKGLVIGGAIPLGATVLVLLGMKLKQKISALFSKLRLRKKPKPETPKPQKVQLEPTKEKPVLEDPNLTPPRIKREKRIEEESDPVMENINTAMELLAELEIEETLREDIAKVVVSTLDENSLRMALLSPRKLRETLESNEAVQDALEEKGIEFDFEDTNGTSHGIVYRTSDLTMPDELLNTPGPWNEILAVTHGIKPRTLRSLVEGFGFEVIGKRGHSQAGHLYVYYKGEPVRGTDGRKVIVKGHGKGIAKGSLNLTLKNLALYMWNNRNDFQ